jgi:D-alanyl-D-alanine carboxypeptidase
VRTSRTFPAAATAAALVIGGATYGAAPGAASIGDRSPTVHSRHVAKADGALDRSLKRLVAMRGGPPGVIAVVQRGSHRIVHTYGVANLRTGRRMTIHDSMRIASTSKAFSGAAALSLVSKGALSLGDTIGKLLPGLPQAWSAVTLRQLLNHTSGLPDFSKSRRFIKALLASLTNAPPPRHLLKFVAGKPLNFKPGSDYRYSNSDNVVVGLMIAAVTGRRYPGQLFEQVYQPLGLRKTALPRGVRLPRPYIHGYDNDPQAQHPEDQSKLVAAGWAWASGGMISTPADLNRFIRGYVRGDLVQLRIRAKQRRVVPGGHSEPPGPGVNAAGLAIFRYQARCGTVWGHTGNTLGYTQFMAASPNGRRSVTVSINSQLNPGVGRPAAFRALRSAETRAVCAALAGKLRAR